MRCGACWVERGTLSQRPPRTPTPHHLALLLHLLRVLGQLEAHAQTEVFSHQLPLASKVVNFLKDLYEGLLLAEPGGAGVGEGEGEG